jgi:hypothetical protein
VPVEDGLAEGVFEAVFGVVLLDDGLDLDQAGELGGGGAEGGEQAQAGVDVVDVGGEGEDTADDDAQRGDLFAQVVAVQILDGFDFVGFEVAGIEAVLEGVEVAGLGAARALGSVVVVVMLRW